MVDFDNLKQLKPIDVVQFAMDAIERVFYIPQLLKAKGSLIFLYE